MSNVIAIDPPLGADAEKDAPLRDDIRLLGRLLGDTVREQEGGEVFDLVERIRQASIRFHRDNEVAARAASSRRSSTASTTTRRSPSCAPSAISRIWPISPRISTTSAATAPMWSALGAAAGLDAPRAEPRARGRLRRHGARALLRPRPGQPGADRPSDRGAAQEHADPRTGDRRAHRRARARSPATRWKCQRNEERLRRAILLVVAHQHAAPDSGSR